MGIGDIMGKLYIVGTPIGNLGDMTYRAIETLKTVDFICAEDMRVTAKLLNYFEIKTPTVSYHEHNAKTAGDMVVDRILAGENAAIVTDAGMPCISDPGEDLVKLCAEKDKALEINMGGLKYPINKPAPDIDTIKRYKELGGRLVSVGSDSHYAERIGFGIPRAYEIAREAGFDFVAKFKERKAFEFAIK